MSSIHSYLEFEKPVADLQGKVQELRSLANDDGAPDVADEIQRLEIKAAEALKDIYAKLTPWQKALVARHANRPQFMDYVGQLVSELTPLAGDRSFGEDAAIVAGLGRLQGRPIVIMGHQRGSDTKSRIHHNFGMARPEGYRKAVRVMELAERFQLPVVTLVDTAGAYPGIGAEERGQAEAIARSTDACLALSVPNVTVIIGEGGSGGAIALATANRVFMLEHAIYSVISPEGAASILWHDAGKAADAAANMKITAMDLKNLGVIDGIIPEPVGGAHRGKTDVIAATGEVISGALQELCQMEPHDIREARRAKFLEIGRTIA